MPRAAVKLTTRTFAPTPPQAGAVAGPGLSATLPVLDPRKKVDADTLQRRERRLLIKWVWLPTGTCGGTPCLRGWC